MLTETETTLSKSTLHQLLHEPENNLQVLYPRQLKKNTKTQQITEVEISKTLRLVYDKRVLLQNYSTVPYGTRPLIEFGTVKCGEAVGPYKYLSNLFHSTVTYDGIKFNSAEALYQWGKFPHRPVVQNDIRYAIAPFWSWKAGNDNGKAAREDWDKVKEAVMRETVFLKFSQTRWLKESLLATGDRKLVNVDPDPYWGTGVNGGGRNRLVELRQYFQN